MFENFFPEIIWIIFAVFVFLRRILKNQPPTPSKPQTPRSSDEFVTSTLETQSQRMPSLPGALMQPIRGINTPPRVSSRIEDGTNKLWNRLEPKVVPIGVSATPTPSPIVSLEQQKLLNGIVFSMILAPRKYEQKPREFNKL